MSFSCLGVPKFGKVFGGFWGSEIRKHLRVVFGFQNSERALGGSGAPKFGKVFDGFSGSEFRKVFGWFWGSEIRYGLWVVFGSRNSEILGFRNSERSFGSFASKKVFLILSKLRSFENLEVEWNQ